MEIRISVNQLSKALGMLQGVIQKKTTMPILSNIRISATGSDKVTLSGTNLDISMEVVRKCEILTPGEATIPAKAFLDIVRMLPGPGVTIVATEDSQIQIKSAKTNAKLNALPAGEFPQLPNNLETEFFEIESALFVKMIQKTLYSTSLDENRYNLTGVFVEYHPEMENRLNFVSTDGHRLSQIEQYFEKSKIKLPRSIVLPRKGLTELIRVSEQEETPTFELGVTDQHAIFKCGDTTLSMRLIDGQFPDYHQVIPKLSDKILRVDRQDLLKAVKRVSVLTSDKSQCLRIQPGAHELKVSCINPDAGEVSDVVSTEYNGPEMLIGFNAKYMIEALSSLEEDVAMMKFTDPLSPALLTGAKTEQHVCVIMPMRL